MAERVWWWGLAIIGILVGCVPALVQPVEEDLRWVRDRWPETTLQDLEAGRSMYVEKCSGCHNLERPEDYPPEKWPKLMKQMAEEAELEPDEQLMIERYLVAASARLRNPPTEPHGP